MTFHVEDNKELVSHSIKLMNLQLFFKYSEVQIAKNSYLCQLFEYIKMCLCQTDEGKNTFLKFLREYPNEILLLT